MNLMTTRPVLTVLALGLGTSLTLAGCGSAAMPVASPPTSAMVDKGMADKTTAMADKTMTDPMMTDKPSAMAKGTYVSYADYQSSMSMYQGSKVVLFFQDSGKFNYRYSTLGFQDAAHLDDGDMWPSSYALTAWTPVVEARVVELVRAAIS